MPQDKKPTQEKVIALEVGPMRIGYVIDYDLLGESHIIPEDGGPVVRFNFDSLSDKITVEEIRAMLLQKNIHSGAPVGPRVVFRTATEETGDPQFAYFVQAIENSSSALVST